jgi:hypothetical protein
MGVETIRTFLYKWYQKNKNDISQPMLFFSWNENVVS